MKTYRFTTEIEAVRAHAALHGAELVEWGGGVDVIVPPRALRAFDSALPAAPDEAAAELPEPPAPVTAAVWKELTDAVDRGDTEIAVALVKAETERVRLRAEPNADIEKPPAKR